MESCAQLTFIFFFFFCLYFERNSVARGKQKPEMELSNFKNSSSRISLAELFKQRVLTKPYQEYGFLQIELDEESGRGLSGPYRRDISGFTGTMRDQNVFMNSDNTLKDHITLRGLRYILPQTLGCELRRNRVDGPASK